jgi:hypothetical protein
MYENDYIYGKKTFGQLNFISISLPNQARLTHWTDRQAEAGDDDEMPNQKKLVSSRYSHTSLS